LLVQFGLDQNIAEKKVPLFFYFRGNSFFDWGNSQRTIAFTSFLGSLGSSACGLYVCSFSDFQTCDRLVLGSNQLLQGV
jgi:hypothetical protein